MKQEINAIHTELTPEIKKYITKKINKLDKYVPRNARESLRAEVRLKESSVKQKKQYTCEVTLHLPQENITTKETTLNMFAAVDIVETKLRNQLKKYKEQHSLLRGHTRRLLNKISSRG